MFSGNAYKKSQENDIMRTLCYNEKNFGKGKL